MRLPRHDAACSRRTRRFPLGLALLATITAATAGVAEEPPFIRDLFVKHNQARAQNGLQPLRYNALLAKAAQSQAEWMARGRKPVTGKPEEHLREKRATPQEFRTCNWYPVNRVINAGYFPWDEMFIEQNGPDGARRSPTEEQCDPSGRTGSGDQPEHEVAARERDARPGHGVGPATDPNRADRGGEHSRVIRRIARPERNAVHHQRFDPRAAATGDEHVESVAELGHA